MRNLKKILALVLALVMTMSVMATAAFTDAATIDTSYDEAAEVLAGLKVFVGRPDGSFDPKANITRQEVAAIVYRIVTGDVDNKSINLYVEGADFDDVKATDWAAGYIGYCNNAGFIAGYGNGKFGPTDNVTGMQAAAMILRAVGYDAQDEFTGADWDKYVAKYAQELGLFKNLKADVNLNKPVSREVVAEILFQAIQADMVEWTPAFDYQPVTFLGFGTQSLGEKTFGLRRSPATGSTTVDNWGRPGHFWYADKVSTTKAVATIVDDYIVKYTAPVAECAVAHDTAVNADKNYSLYVNGKTPVGNYMVNALDTVTKIGAQGRLTEVYKDRIVMIDTFLAKVNKVTPATFDAAGHLRTASAIELYVYDATEAGAGTYATLTLNNGKTNYTYVAGDMVLVHAYTNTNTATASGDVITGTGKYGEIYGVAESFEGTQSIIWWNASQHTVNGTLYNDNGEFHLDQAGIEVTNHKWFLDQYGNLIGVVDLATQFAYGVIESIWWADDAATGSGKAMANVVYLDGSKNTVQIANMTINTAAAGSAASVLSGVATYSTLNTNDMRVTDGYFYVANYAATNANAAAEATNDVIAGNLFRFTTNLNGTVNAYEVGGNGAGNPLYKNDYSTTTAITKGVSQNGTLLINEDTQFLVRSGAGTAASPYVWTAITGYTNIGSYVSAEVDYINLDTDVYAEIVYVIGASTAAKTSSLFYLTSLTVHEVRLLDGVTVDYYVLEGIVDGTAGSIKIAGTDAGRALVAQIIPGWPTGVTTNYTNRMFLLSVTNGYVTNVCLADAPVQATGSYANFVIPTMYETGYANSAYTGLTVKYIVGAAGDNWNGTVYFDGEQYFNGAELTPVVGEWAADMSGKNVHVVYKAATDKLVAVYIVDKADTAVSEYVVNALNVASLGNISDGDALITSVAVTAAATTTGGSFDATQLAATKGTVTWQKRNTTTGNFEAFAADTFVPGTYKATITVATTAVDAATGYAYSINLVPNGLYYAGDASTSSTTTITVAITVA